MTVPPPPPPLPPPPKPPAGRSAADAAKARPVRPAPNDPSSARPSDPQGPSAEKGSSKNQQPAGQGQQGQIEQQELQEKTEKKQDRKRKQASKRSNPSQPALMRYASEKVQKTAAGAMEKREDKKDEKAEQEAAEGQPISDPSRAPEDGPLSTKTPDGEQREGTPDPNAPVKPKEKQPPGAASKAVSKATGGLVSGEDVSEISQNLRGDAPKQSKKGELKTLGKDIAKGAADGAQTGGLAGAKMGAIKGAATGFLKTKKGRRTVWLAGGAALIIPLLIASMIVAMGAGVMSAINILSRDEPSAQAVSDNLDIDPNELTPIMEAVGGSPVPWQLMYALEESATGTVSFTTGIPDVIEPDGMSCPATESSVENGLSENALLVYRCGRAAFPEITGWGGVGDRPDTSKSDHPNGNAIDAMIPNWETPDGRQFGWEAAQWYRANSVALGIKYIIYDKKIWTGDDWDPYDHPSGDMSSPNLTHENHIHVSVYPSGKGLEPGDMKTSVGGGSGGKRGGYGVYGFGDDAEIPEFLAEHPTAAATYLTPLIADALARVQDPAIGLDMHSGVLYSDVHGAKVAISTEEYEEKYDDDDEGPIDVHVDDALAFQAEQIRQTYIAALMSLDGTLANMDEKNAELVYDIALAWFLGQDAPTGGICVASGDPDNPSELSVPGPGYEFTLNSNQINNAAAIIGAGEAAGVGQHGIIIALMTAIQESTLMNYANDGTDTRLTQAQRDVVVKSLDLPNEAIGRDWDSVGLFQQRPSAGWGTVEELMTPSVSASKFYEALEKVNGWEDMDPGSAAQAVQISAHPDLYDQWLPAAEMIATAIAGIGCDAFGDIVYSAEGWTHPVPGAWISSGYSPTRVHPITGLVTPHLGTDLAIAGGTPIRAAQDGVVIKVGGCAGKCIDPEYGISGYFIAVSHGDGIITTYNHMLEPSNRVVGEPVSAGDIIGKVGSTGYSTGDHLHFAVITGPGQWTDPVPFMKKVGVEL